MISLLMFVLKQTKVTTQQILFEIQISTLRRRNKICLWLIYSIAYTFNILQKKFLSLRKRKMNFSRELFI